ncbi:hypothetical protein CC1G_14739 [Coprinopsis cinerea okayama7|uniref:Uncharacterized protein n=1 Tax=Coprinopsis cinerea (strain Okayama-7 / 130 / ATCC MYA-4618 / FGSC 9003) TaxID=240176 RepID=D6RMT7_COPC7|nr:hypothetical protein CC1G_14739 [Coprinopsis cinerea okayama7\|eukprot:XP_002911310.1 hypothetical protein CC1G_14739 [Coprinopsis cinerea okayama7\
MVPWNGSDLSAGSHKERRGTVTIGSTTLGEKWDPLKPHNVRAPVTQANLITGPEPPSLWTSHRLRNTPKALAAHRLSSPPTATPATNHQPSKVEVARHLAYNNLPGAREVDQASISQEPTMASTHRESCVPIFKLQARQYVNASCMTHTGTNSPKFQAKMERDVQFCIVGRDVDERGNGLGRMSWEDDDLQTIKATRPEHRSPHNQPPPTQLPSHIVVMINRSKLQEQQQTCNARKGVENENKREKETK